MQTPCHACQAPETFLLIFMQFLRSLIAQIRTQEKPRTIMDDSFAYALLPSPGDVPLAFAVPTSSQHHRSPLRHRVFSNATETGPPKSRDSLVQSVSEVLSAGGDDVMNIRRDRRSVRVLMQTKIYNFLERPTGWRCFLYHFCV